MINFSFMILTLSCIGSILFGLLMIFMKVEKDRCIRETYLLMKMVVLFFLIPAIVLTLWIYGRNTEFTKVEISLPDFPYMYIISGPGTRLFNLEIVKRIDKIVFIIWAAGFMAFYMIQLMRSMIAYRKLMRLSILIDNPQILKIQQDIQGDLRLKRRIRLYSLPGINSPFSSGIFRVKVFLPAEILELYSADEVRMLLRHETIHCKHHDVLFKMLVKFVQKLHWFNPVLLVFQKKFYELSEFACDIETVEDYDSKQKLGYGDLIIKTAETKKKFDCVPLFSEKKESFIKRRLFIMMKRGGYRKMRLAAMAVLYLAACPIVVYAASSGAICIRAKLYDLYNSKHETIFENQTYDEEWETETLDYTEKSIVFSEQILDIGERTSFHTFIDPRQELHFKPISLHAGDTIQILASDDQNRKLFKAGILNNGVSRFVRAVDGGIVYTFRITKDGEYTVYIEGLEDEGSIDLTGTIKVRQGTDLTDRAAYYHSIVEKRNADILNSFHLSTDGYRELKLEDQEYLDLKLLPVRGQLNRTYGDTVPLTYINSDNSAGFAVKRDKEGTNYLYHLKNIGVGNEYKWIITSVEMCSGTISREEKAALGQSGIADEVEISQTANEVETAASETVEKLPASWSMNTYQDYDYPVLDYASDDRVILHGYYGLFIYDLVEEKLVDSLDLKNINCQRVQTGGQCEVQVSKDGEIVWIKPYNSNIMYTYHTTEKQLKKEVSRDIPGANVFQDIVNTHDVLQGEKDIAIERCSDETVSFQDGSYGYLYLKTMELSGLLYVRGEDSYNLFTEKDCIQPDLLKQDESFYEYYRQKSKESYVMFVYIYDIMFHAGEYAGICQLSEGLEYSDDIQREWKEMRISPGYGGDIRVENSRTCYEMVFYVDNSRLEEFPNGKNTKYLYCIKDKDGWYADGPLRDSKPDEEWWNTHSAGINRV